MSKKNNVVEIRIRNVALDETFLEAIKALVEQLNSAEASPSSDAKLEIVPSSTAHSGIGQNVQKSDIIKELKPFLDSEGDMREDGKRIYRRPADLFDPNSKPTDEVNKLTSKLTPRVSRAHVGLFNACADAFPNKRAALERAVELLAQETGVKIDLE